MILDQSEYPHGVRIRIDDYDFEVWAKIIIWGKENNIPVEMSFGWLWFTEAEHAVLFRLSFNV